MVLSFNSSSSSLKSIAKLCLAVQMISTACQNHEQGTADYCNQADFQDLAFCLRYHGTVTFSQFKLIQCLYPLCFNSRTKRRYGLPVPRNSPSIDLWKSKHWLDQCSDTIMSSQHKCQPWLR